MFRLLEQINNDKVNGLDWKQYILISRVLDVVVNVCVLYVALIV